MLKIEDALCRVLARAPLVETERIPLTDALGRVLSTDLTSPCSLPHWDNSAMDGYAMRAEDSKTNVPDAIDCESPKAEGLHSYQLEIVEVIAAGRAPTERVGPGQCSRIMTGAPMPEGADSVLIQEQVEASPGHIQSSAPVSVGQNVRRAGEEIRSGDPLVMTGTVMSPGTIGLCASVGLQEIEVSRALRVGVLSTGEEVMAPGTPLRPGQIWSSNNISLHALAREAGAIPVDLGQVGDSLEALVHAIQQASRSDLDLLLTTGGVSVGDFDRVKEAFGQAGMTMDFWKIRMKPGKPLAFGHLDSMPVFGLPGNPVSCMVGFLQFVRPLIRSRMGDLQPYLPVLCARFRSTWHRRPGRNEFLRVQLEQVEGELVADLTGGQGSGMVSSMARAQGLALIGHEATHLLPGDRIDVQLISPGQLSQAEPGFQWGGRK